MLTIAINLLIICCILGLVWYVSTLIPMPPPLRIGANIAIAVIAIVLLIGILGGDHSWGWHGVRLN